MAISFHKHNVKFQLRASTTLRRFIESRVMPQSKKQLELSYVFCNDEFLLGLNRTFLNHDYYTDIITFPIEEDKGKIKAEIYISIERVKENAEKLKVDFNEELLRVMFHGILHLMGYKDKTKLQKAAMRNEEDKWIRAFKKFSLNG
jgi:probable rRNA maturation factor